MRKFWTITPLAVCAAIGVNVAAPSQAKAQGCYTNGDQHYYYRTTNYQANTSRPYRYHYGRRYARDYGWYFGPVYNSDYYSPSTVRTYTYETRPRRYYSYYSSPSSYRYVTTDTMPVYKTCQRRETYYQPTMPDVVYVPTNTTTTTQASYYTQTYPTTTYRTRTYTAYTPGYYRYRSSYGQSTYRRRSTYTQRARRRRYSYGYSHSRRRYYARRRHRRRHYYSGYSSNFQTYGMSYVPAKREYSTYSIPVTTTYTTRCYQPARTASYYYAQPETATYYSEPVATTYYSAPVTRTYVEEEPVERVSYERVYNERCADRSPAYGTRWGEYSNSGFYRWNRAERSGCDDDD